MEPPTLAAREVPQDLSLRTSLARHIGGVIPRILDALDRTDDLFDRVSRIRMPRWSQGRIALVGEAAYCVSLRRIEAKELFNCPTCNGRYKISAGRG
jgi:2-polyprenyl-6-methoxyphenol hydroxylase-like FAD-dependent oxidoreductase